LIGIKAFDTLYSSASESVVIRYPAPALLYANHELFSHLLYVIQPALTNDQPVYVLANASQSFSGNHTSHLNHSTFTLPEKFSAFINNIDHELLYVMSVRSRKSIFNPMVGRILLDEDVGSDMVSKSDSLFPIALMSTKYSSPLYFETTHCIYTFHW
jgi:hypothetical protein